MSPTPSPTPPLYRLEPDSLQTSTRSGTFPSELPAQLGGHVIKLHFVVIVGGEEKVLGCDRGIPSDVRGDRALLNPVSSDHHQVIFDGIRQVVFHLRMKPSNSDPTIAPTSVCLIVLQGGVPKWHDWV